MIFPKNESITRGLSLERFSHQQGFHNKYFHREDVIKRLGFLIDVLANKETSSRMVDEKLLETWFSACCLLWENHLRPLMCCDLETSIKNSSRIEVYPHEPRFLFQPSSYCLSQFLLSFLLSTSIFFFCYLFFLSLSLCLSLMI